MLLALLLLAAVGCTHQSTPQAQNLKITAAWTPNLVQWDIPTELSDKSETAHIWLPRQPPAGKPIHVHAFASSQVKLDQTEFDLTDTRPQAITIAKVTTKPSLAQIVLEIEDGGGQNNEISKIVNIGFHPAIKFNVPPLISGGSTVGFSVRTLDETGKAVPMPAPVFLLLNGVNVKFASGTNSLQNNLRVPLQIGANATPPLKMVPEPMLAGGTGSVQVELRTNDDYVISSSESQEFTIPVALRLQFAMAILGGLLNSLYATIVLLLDHGTETWRTVGARAGIGIVAGILTVLFADKAAVLGINLQGSSLIGYVAAGFLVAYLGIDAFFARGKLSPATTPQARTE
jgi:hypothetical protein